MPEPHGDGAVNAELLFVPCRAAIARAPTLILARQQDYLRRAVHIDVSDVIGQRLAVDRRMHLIPGDPRIR